MALYAICNLRITKLIVSQRRRVGAAKAEKDLAQAEALIEVLSVKRSPALRGAWEEAYGRGPSGDCIFSMGSLSSRLRHAIAC